MGALTELDHDDKYYCSRCGRETQLAQMVQIKGGGYRCRRGSCIDTPRRKRGEGIIKVISWRDGENENLG